MAEHLVSFVVTVRAESIGVIMGKLAEPGAWPDGLEPEDHDGNVVYTAILPVTQVESVREFIADIPRANAGSFER